MQPRHFEAGVTIFRDGDPSSEVFIIEDGEVAISVGDVEVIRLHAGELFGESGVLEGRPRAATATAMTATDMLVTPGETFAHAFGMDNDRALSLVKLLCRRLRSTTLRAAQSGHLSGTVETSSGPPAAIRLLPDHTKLTTDYHMTPVDVRHLPFQVGNRFGGEAVPIESNRSIVIPAHGATDLAAPHFELLRRDGHVGVRDLGSRLGTIVNGVKVDRSSVGSFMPLRPGENQVIAGRADSAFRFRVIVRPG